MIVDSNRALIITDPCYFALDKDWGSEYGFDYDNMTIQVPEITDYIWINTGFGDGSGHVFISENSYSQYELEEAIINLRKESSELFDDFRKLGRFGVDSGTFGVFFYDEVLKYNPNFAIEVGSWSYSVVPDFMGAIYDTAIDDTDESSEDTYCYNYLIGSGNKSICTVW